ncbi:MAG: hypothetical protein ABJF10_24205 [Chthoniobacter sp.]|uniref:hypothetical protein n=1 Tax=Chthoniobacter sp. TaxID=2510640 RepID=UPI0032AAD513
MSQATSQMRDLAARLIACEANGNSSSVPNPSAVFHVCERLRPHLAALMGKGGFHAVLSRALAVAATEVRWLRVVKVNADGMLEGWEQAEKQVDAKEPTEAGALLVAHLLGLLVAFIGDNLTLRVVRDVWPKLSLEDLNFTTGDHS